MQTGLYKREVTYEKGFKKQNAASGEKKSVGLRTKMIGSILIPLVLVLCSLGILLHSRIVSIVETLKEAEISAQVDTATKTLDGYFQPYITAAELLSTSDTIQRMFDEVKNAGSLSVSQEAEMEEAVGEEMAQQEAETADLEEEMTEPEAAVSVSSPADFKIENSPICAEVMEELSEVHDSMGSSLARIWIAVLENSQLVLSDTKAVQSGYEVWDRPWYLLMKNRPGETIVSSAYEESVLGTLVVSVVAPVYDGGEVVGMIGLNVSLQNLINDLGSIVIGDEGYITVLDTSQNVIYHKDEELILSNLQELEYSDNILSALNAKTDTDIIEYQHNGAAYHGAHHYIDSLDWQVLGCMRDTEFAGEGRLVTLIMVIGFSVCAILLAGICVLVANTLIQPIKRLDAVAEQLADGDLDVELQITSNDELGKLAGNISRLVERLKNYIAYIDEVSGVLEGLGNGNLVFELKQEYVGEFNRLKIAMNSIQEALSTTMFRIVDAAAQVDGSTSQIASASQSLAQGAAEQASTVQGLASSVQTLSEQSVTEEQRALELRDGITAIGKDLLKNNEQMKEMVTAMENIRVQSNEIEKVIKAIEDIAFQTNILALNAAVEAARAGEAGKGFAVVAEEVRNLATKSSESAKSSGQLIENSIQAVQDGFGIANQTADALRKIAEEADGIVASMEAFAKRYQEQNGQLGDISNGIEQISAVVQTNSATAEETAASSAELSEQARLMKDLMAQFYIDERFHER